MARISVIVVAAGEGSRFGFPKQLALLKGKAILDWCLERFEAHSKVSEIILVLNEEALRDKERYLKHFRKISAVTKGGKKRQDSVLSGFKQINQEKTGIVLVHDGVRPIIGKDLIDRVITAAEKKGAAVPVIPVEDTVKLVDGEKVLRTENREKLFRAQTPQGFQCPILQEALEKAVSDEYYGTDEASLVERTGRDVFVVQGERRNIKVTTREDLKIAEAFLED